MEDSELASFITLPFLREQLAVVEYNIRTTPDTLQAARRMEKLHEEKAQLENLMAKWEQKERERTQDDDDDDMEGVTQDDACEVDSGVDTSFSSTTESPDLSAPPEPFTGTTSVAPSGYATPELLHPTKGQETFGSTMEEPFLNESARIAQELAYIPRKRKKLTN